MSQLTPRQKAIYLSGTIIFFHALFLLFFQNNHRIAAVASDLFQTAAPTISGIWLYKKYVQEKSGDRKFWLFLSMTIFCYGIAMLFLDYDEIYLNTDAPFPSIADVFWLLMYVFTLLAYIYLMYINRQVIRLGQMVYDALIIVVVATTAGWAFILKPMFGDIVHQGLWYQIVGISYPIGNLAILFILICLFSTEHLKMSFQLFPFLFFGTCCFLIANTLFLFLLRKGEYTPGNSADLLWTMGIFLIGMASFYSRGEILIVKDQVDIVKINHKQLSKYFLSLRLWTPYIGAGALFLMMMIKGDGMNSLHYGSILAILLIIFRQIYTLVQNDALLEQAVHLNKELEFKVQQRTKQLFRKNQQLKESMGKVEYMAFHDSLTELPNRRYFEKHLKKALKSAKETNEKVAVLFLDLDRFKLINDTLGHSTGDLVLQQVAGRLQTCVGEGGMVSRHGGDEFLVMLPGADRKKAAETAENILESLRKVLMAGGQELFITSSIGISLYPEDGTEPELLTKRADAALYASKNAFRNQYHFYDSSMNVVTLADLDLEKELRLALEKEEFILCYQPLVQIETGRLKGVEALIRWNHPVKGTISPGAFIPLAEESGFIIPLGLWVLETACRQWKQWVEKGLPPITLAVNISIKQFFHLNFIMQIREVLEKSGMDPGYLELEITENTFVSCRMAAIFEELKQIGIKISIDDFGTGYSSLQYLKRLPITKLKIDQSFIRDIPNGVNDVAIVQTIIAMAHHMNLEVVAEGVEETEQLDFLQKYHCHTAQGYLFSKPLSAEDLEAGFLEPLVHRQ